MQRYDWNVPSMSYLKEDPEGEWVRFEDAMAALAAAAPSPEAEPIGWFNPGTGGFVQTQHGWVREDHFPYHTVPLYDRPAAPGAHPAPTAQPEPLDMVLHCPACGLQHIDAPESHDRFLALSDPPAAWSMPAWKNEPHRSHLCHGCGHIWRPADVPTNGVQAVKTKGKNDGAMPTVDLKRTAYDQLQQAASESNWIPPEYYANDWIADCCRWLREGPMVDAAPSPAAEPVAWRYELATTINAGVYGGWEWRIGTTKPHVREGSIRNLVGLYAAPGAHPAPTAQPDPFATPAREAGLGLTADARDAARYRWWREQHEVTLVTRIFGNGCVNKTIAMVEEFVDAALAAAQEKRTGEATPTKPQHVCGQQGFGALGDTCPACDSKEPGHG